MSQARTEGLDRITRFLHNKAVRRYFRDIPDTPDPDLTQPRVAAKQYFLLEDNDSAIYATKAMQCFVNYCIADQANEINYYSIPIDTWNITSTHLPQITLYFKPRLTADNPNKSIRPMEVSFRLRESKVPDTNAELKLIANDIYRIFCTPLYRYERGKYKMSYRDKKLGYEFILGFRNETDAINLIKDVMSILNDRDEFNPSILKRSEPIQETYVASEQRVRILGKNKQLPNRYENVNFIFSHADFKAYPDKPKRIIWRGEVII